jgi:hypothetical protein
VLQAVANTPSSRAEATAIGARWINRRISCLLFRCPDGQGWVVVRVLLVLPVLPAAPYDRAAARVTTRVPRRRRRG